MRIAVIGIGYWGPNIVRNLVSLDGVSVSGVCDVDPRALQRIAQQYPGIPVFGEIDALYSPGRSDAVVIATPAGSHYEHVRRALESGMHVMVEKPLATSAKEADELIVLANRKGVTLMVGHTFLYSNLVREVKNRIGEGDLGDVYYIYSQRLNLGRIRDDVDVLWNLAPHDVSIINFWLDARPIEVSAWSLSYLYQHKGITDVAFARMDYAGGKTAHIHLSWLDPLKVRRMVVVGSQKMLVYDDVNNDWPIQIFDKGVEKEFTAPADYVDFRFRTRTGDLVAPHVEAREPLHEELAHFVHCIQHGTRPLTDGHHGLQVISILESMNQSLAEKGHPIKVRYFEDHK